MKCLVNLQNAVDESFGVRLKMLKLSACLHVILVHDDDLQIRSPSASAPRSVLVLLAAVPAAVVALTAAPRAAGSSSGSFAAITHQLEKALSMSCPRAEYY